MYTIKSYIVKEEKKESEKKKKRILILSFYFPPCTGTAAPRPYSWAKVFVKKGFDVTVVSKHWTGKEKTWDEMTQSTKIQSKEVVFEEGYKKIFLPYQKYKYYDSGLYRKLKSIYNLLAGNLEIEVNALQFQEAIEEEFESNDFDFIIASCPPWNLVKLAYSISQKYKVPFAIDCRDYENDVILPLKPQLSLFRRFEFLANKFHIKRWAKHASLIVGASKPISDYVSNFTGVKGVEITNGYDEDLFNSLPQTTPYSKFTISVLGYLYPPQDLSILYEGMQEFLRRVDKPKFHFKFVGVNAIESVAKEIRENIPAEYITITDRISQKEALEIGLQSHALFYAGWTNWRGVYSAKIFEYLALRKNILIAPGDNFAIDQLLNASKAGEIANDPNTFADILEKWYLNWKVAKENIYQGDVAIIEQYSRQNQAEILLDNIKEVIK